MPDILHRYTIDASPERVHELIATKEGVARWWTGHANRGQDGPGGTIELYFAAPDPAATVEIVEDTPHEIVWRVSAGPEDWVDTRVTFAIRPRPDGGTTLLFTHAGWREANEFMHGCSTNWAAYLTSLKAGAERDEFAPYPAGEMSRWS